jgi:hypothetical protein
VVALPVIRLGSTFVAAASIACSIPALALAATPPFALVDPAGNWRTVQLERPVSGGVEFEEAIVHVGHNDRFLVLSRDPSASPPLSLEEFAAVLHSAFSTETGPPARGKHTTFVGFSGLDLHFPMTTDKGAFACELFVFADHDTLWGVLYSRLPADPAPPSPVFSLLQPRTHASPGTFELPPFHVMGRAVCSFPISFRVFGQPRTHLVDRLLVSEVLGDDRFSSAIEVGDEIVAIDGRPSREFNDRVERDSELGRLFLNRHTGETIDLDLVSAKTHQRYSVTLRAGSYSYRPDLAAPGRWGRR